MAKKKSIVDSILEKIENNAKTKQFIADYENLKHSAGNLGKLGEQELHELHEKIKSEGEELSARFHDITSNLLQQVKELHESKPKSTAEVDPNAPKRGRKKKVVA